MRDEYDPDVVYPEDERGRHPLRPVGFWLTFLGLWVIAVAAARPIMAWVEVWTVPSRSFALSLLGLMVMGLNVVSALGGLPLLLALGLCNLLFGRIPEEYSGHPGMPTGAGPGERVYDSRGREIGTLRRR